MAQCVQPQGLTARRSQTHSHVAIRGLRTHAPTDPLRAYAPTLVFVLDLAELDLDEIATALADQSDYEHRWLIDPRIGEVVLWTYDTGIDGQNPVDLDELDLVPIDPLPSSAWYADMADFAEGISDDAASRRLSRALRGCGAFRRFKDELFEEYPGLVPAWQAYRDTRAKRRAVEWLLDEGLVDDDAARSFLLSYQDPAIP